MGLISHLNLSDVFSLTLVKSSSEKKNLLVCILEVHTELNTFSIVFREAKYSFLLYGTLLIPQIVFFFLLTPISSYCI